MNKFLLILILSFSLTHLSAQEAKYNSLLWEISGNGLGEPSYLYGTMHVSEKIAFHLSDIFFEKILSTDKIALESNPETWLDEMEKHPEYNRFRGMMNNYNSGLYSSFDMKSIEKRDLMVMFFVRDFLTNGIMYRTSESGEDYQEETYLDMFIYQVGRRTNRDVVSLEGFIEARTLVDKSYYANRNHTPKPWAKRMVKDKAYGEVLQDAYRDKNLDRIDSLNKGFNSEENMRFMLYERNANMVRRMDSIMQKGSSLFTAVGAAHLPGEQGMIEMLREKGYTVNPVFGDYTDKGLAQKDKLDEAFVIEPYAPNQTADGMVKLKTAGKIYDFNVRGTSIAVAPDLKNGAFINIIRIAHNDFLDKNNYKTSPERLDSLFFENIPGDILEKKKMQMGKYPAWDISNKTKSGDYQHYRFVITPLEVICVAFLGKKDFVNKQANMVFECLEIKQPDDAGLQNFIPLQGGFQVKIPSLHLVENNSESSNLFQSPNILAYDEEDDDYYFVKQEYLSSLNLLEDSEFEQKRIHYRFYDNLEIDSTHSHWDDKNRLHTESTLKNGKKIKLMSEIKGPYYYLLGTTNKAKRAEEFFNSFKEAPLNYYRKKQLHIDSIDYYQVKLVVKPEPNFRPFFKDDDEEDINYFEDKTNREYFIAESKKEMFVEHRILGRYEYKEKVDSIWHDIIYNNLTSGMEGFEFKNYKQPSFYGEMERKKYKIKKNDEGYPIETTRYVDDVKKYKDKFGFDVMEAVIKDSLSRQAIRAKYMLKNGNYYTIKTVVDRDKPFEKDAFVDEFYETFSPKDTLIGLPLTQRKAPLFFADIRSEHDSIRYSAMKSIRMLEFEEQDFSDIKKLLTNFEFEEKELESKIELIEALEDIASPKVMNFLRDYYKENEGDGNIQLAILKSIAGSDQADVYKEVVQLMEEDLPLPKNQYEINGLFSRLSDDIEESHKILPDIIPYFTIEEYKEPILHFATEVLDTIPNFSKKIKKHKKLLLTHANLEYKRAKSAIADNKTDEYDYYDDNDEDFENLELYLGILSSFNDSAVEEFFGKVSELDNHDLKLAVLEHDLKVNHTNKKLIEELAEENDSRYKLYYTLAREKKLDQFPKKYDKKSIAQSALINKFYRFNKEKDSIHFYEYKELKEGGRIFDAYFYKVTTDREYNDEPETNLAYIAFERNIEGTLDIDNAEHEVSIDFIDDEDLEEKMEIAEDRILFNHKERASFRNNGYYPGY